MPKLEKTATIPVKYVSVDDWFKLGGQMYRVLEVKTFFDTVTLIAEFATSTPLSTIKIEMDGATPFNILNQKQ